MNETYQALIGVWDRTDTDDAQGLHAIGEALVGALQGAAADLAEWETYREQYTRALDDADALRAENADLKEDEQEALAERNAALDQRNALARQHDDLWARAENAEALERLAAIKMEAAEAERDALRAQLDKATAVMRQYENWFDGAPEDSWRLQRDMMTALDMVEVTD